MTFKETESIELKRILNNTVDKEIVSFLNTAGGTIYIGVEDDGEIIGVEKLDENLRKIADIIDTQILPSPKEFVELGTKYIDGKSVIEINVRKGNSLYYIKKYGRSSQGVFVRLGTSCRALSESEIERLHTKYLDSKSKIISIKGKEQKPTFQYLKLLCTEKGLNINNDTFAKNFSLVTDSGEWNLMSDLLCDRNTVSIKVVRFSGDEKGTDIITRNEYGEKCLIVAMMRAYEYCTDVINETKTIFRNGIREDKHLFDKRAFREVWFNACLHNNWIDGTPPAIYIFNNRIEIISTGGLPANLSKEDFFAGISKPVNEELAKLFIRLGLIEQTGFGIPFVSKTYSKSVFEFLDFFLRVTLPFEYILDKDAGLENKSKIGGQKGNTGGQKTINEGGQKENVGGHKTDESGQKENTGGHKTINEGGQKTINEGGQKENVGGQKENVGGQKTNNEGDQKENTGGQKTNNEGGQKETIGGHKTDDGGHKTINEGGQKENTGGQKTINEGGQKETIGGHKTNNEGGHKEIIGGQKTNNEGGQKENTGGQKTIDLILSAIRSNPNISRSELSNLLNIAPSAIQKHLEKLKTQGLVRREGGKKKGHWVVFI